MKEAKEREESGSTHTESTPSGLLLTQHSCMQLNPRGFRKWFRRAVESLFAGYPREVHDPALIFRTSHRIVGFDSHATNRILVLKNTHLSSSRAVWVELGFNLISGHS
jgi:hypothetical protein